MNRDRALEISDALAEAGKTHTISVGVHDGFMPRENYFVKVTPVLSYAPTDLTALQRLADHLRCEIAFIAGSFEFVEASK
jgi:hypothetical protein